MTEKEQMAADLAVLEKVMLDERGGSTLPSTKADALQRIAAAIRSCLAAPGEGMVLVPSEPSKADAEVIVSAHVLAMKARGFARWLRSGDTGDIRPEPDDYTELADMIMTLTAMLAAAPSPQH